MKVASLRGFALLLIAILAVPAFAQTAAQSAGTPAPVPSAAAVGSVSMTSVLPDLDRLQTAAAQTSLDIGHLRIERWKADANSKQQAQANADSIQRNLTSALPGMIEAVRSAPQDVNAEFKLYRNVNALYDVLSSLAESAGAFGSKSEYMDLAQQLESIDTVRRNLGDAIDKLTSSKEYELTQLRDQLRVAQQAAAAPLPPPKKVVVDDNAVAKPAVAAHKKKPAAKKPAATPGTTDSSTPPTTSDPKN